MQCLTKMYFLSVAGADTSPTAALQNAHTLWKQSNKMSITPPSGIFISLSKIQSWFTPYEVFFFFGANILVTTALWYSVDPGQIRNEQTCQIPLAEILWLKMRGKTKITEGEEKQTWNEGWNQAEQWLVELWNQTKCRRLCTMTACSCQRVQIYTNYFLWFLQFCDGC